MINLYQKIAKIYLAMLVIFIPFQSFIREILELRTSLSNENIFWIIHWYEVVLPIFIIATIVELIRKKTFGPLLFLCVSTICLGVASILFLSPSIKIGLEGFRFTLLPLVFFLIVLTLNYRKEELSGLLRIFLYLGALISIVAIVERFLPTYYWSKINLIDQNNGFGYGPRLAGSIVQSTSIIGAPNQLASYLLPAFFISFIRGLKENYLNLATCYLLLATVIAVAIILTFSRSAFVGFFLTLLLFGIFFTKKRFSKYAISSTALGVFAALIALFYRGSEEMRSFLSHGTSQSLHLLAMKDSLNTFLADSVIHKIFGAGLGTAGPLVIKYGSGKISESWYLQILLELGISGLLLLLIFFLFLLIRLKDRSRGLFLGLISLLIASLFLHTFSDNPAIAYTIIIVAGATLTSPFKLIKKSSKELDGR